MEEKTCFSISHVCGDDNGIDSTHTQPLSWKDFRKKPRGEFSPGGTATEIPSEHTLELTGHLQF